MTKFKFSKLHKQSLKDSGDWDVRIEQTQKQREKEANQIAFKFYAWLGYRVCDGVEDELSLRRLVKKIEREAVRQYKLNKEKTK